MEFPSTMTNASIRLCTFNALKLGISHVLDTQSRMMGCSSSYISHSVLTSMSSEACSLLRTTCSSEDKQILPIPTVHNSRFMKLMYACIMCMRKVLIHGG